MSGEAEIAWFTLTLNFPPDQEAWLEQTTQAAGLLLTCSCIDMLYKHLRQDASTDRMKSWQQQLPITPRRNGCNDTLLSDFR